MNLIKNLIFSSQINSIPLPLLITTLIISKSLTNKLNCSSIPLHHLFHKPPVLFQLLRCKPDNMVVDSDRLCKEERVGE